MKHLILLALLAAGVAQPVWAQNAAQISSVRAGQDCTGCDLFQGDFSGLQTTGQDLSGSRLRQADLSLSVFSGARFGRSDLRDVEAYGAVFSRADLRRADLTNASLVGAHFGGADLSGAILTGANLSGAELGSARGLSQTQVDRACGDAATTLPGRLRMPTCAYPRSSQGSSGSAASAPGERMSRPE